MRAALLAALAVGLLAGCGTATAPTAPPESTAAAPGVAATVAAPATLTYPAVGVDRAPLGPTGLTDTGELAVPDLSRPEDIVYANWSQRLTGQMPTVLASHVNGRDPAGNAIPGGFARLKQATAGDTLTLARADGTATRYQVQHVDTIDKDTFPTAQVYAPGPPGRLVLITCGGDIDTEARSYESNVIVTAQALP